MSLSIGQVAERTGLSVHALRFYEREGLFAGPVQRGPGGRRVYSEDDVSWLEICTKFRASGMPLTAIRQYTHLVRQGAGNEQERLDLLRAHLERLATQIGELNECLTMITHKVKIYEEHLAEGTAGQLWASPPSSGD
jgi:DNA-binding transcriptional MerR regulator